jgi:hypothetical protein
MQPHQTNAPLRQLSLLDVPPIPRRKLVIEQWLEIIANDPLISERNRALDRGIKEQEQRNTYNRKRRETRQAAISVKPVSSDLDAATGPGEDGEIGADRTQSRRKVSYRAERNV